MRRRRLRARHGRSTTLWEPVVELPLDLDRGGTGDLVCTMEITVDAGIAAVGVHVGDEILCERLLDARRGDHRTVLIPFFASEGVQDHRLVVRNGSWDGLDVTVWAVRVTALAESLDIDREAWWSASRMRPAGMIYDASYAGTLAEWLVEGEASGRHNDPDWRFTRLRRIVELAHRACPGYREHWRASGWQPSDLRTLDDAMAIPPISKAEIRADMPSFTLPRRHLHAFTTSGSTGEPFRFYYSRMLQATHTAALKLLLDPARPDAPMLYVGTTGSPALVKIGHSGTVRIGSRLCANPELLAQLIETIRPDVVYGWASVVAPALDIVAARTNHRFARVALASERVLPGQLASMSRVTDSIGISYGTSEGVALAQRCPECHHYVEHPGFGITTLRPRADGLQDITGTSFVSLGTLFIAYEVGDVALPASLPATECRRCPGDEVVRFSDVVGRAQEMIPGPTGDVPVLPLSVSLSRRLSGWEDVVLFDFQWRSSEPRRATLRYQTHSGREVDEARARELLRMDAPELDFEVRLHPGLSAERGETPDEKWRLVKRVPETPR